MSTFSDNIQAARAKTAETDKQKAEFNAMITEMRRTQAATLAGSSKPSVILTDQTDLGDKIKELTDKTVTAISQLDIEGTSKREVAAINDVASAIHDLELTVETYITALDRQTVQIVAAIKKIELSPKITVSPAAVHATSSVDLKPIEKALKELKGGTKKAFSLNDYRAHDLDDAPDGTQYIGYIALDGSWYIIQSNDNSNSMRYFFGASDYSRGWEDRYSHDYTTLSEAVNAL